MKFQSTPQELKHVLQTVSKAAGSKEMPILGSVLLEAANNTLTCSATDLNLSIRGSLKAEVFESGRVAVPKQFLSVVNKLPSGPVVVSTEGAQVGIKYGDNSVKLNCFDAEEFPAIPEVSGSEFTLDFDPGLVSFAAAGEKEPIAVLKGVLFDLAGGNAVATDKYLLAKQKIQPVEGGGKYAIPVSMAARLQKGMKVKFSNAMVSASSDDGFIYSSRLIDGEYPQYQKVIPESYGIKVKMDASALKDAVERAALIAEKVILDISGLSISVSASSEEGVISETLAAMVEGDDLRIAFHSEVLAETLRHVHVKDDLILGFNGAKHPMGIMPGGEWSGILVPVVAAGA